MGVSNVDLICGQGILHLLRRVGMRLEYAPPLVQSPIVIAGLPRTGTTFLQRFLHEQGVGKGQTLFEQMFPSSVLQNTVHPFLPLLSRISPTRHHRPEIHTTGLESIETDEAGLFFQQLDGFFLYAFFWALDEEEHLSFFDVRHRDETERDFSWLENCWRHSTKNNQLPPLAKLFGLGASVPSFLEYFPTAKLIYTARDPCAVIPSTLSLLLSVLRQRYDWEGVTQAKKNRYISRITSALIELMYRFHLDWEAKRISSERCLIIPYEKLLFDFPTVMEYLCSFLGYEPSQSLQESIVKQGAHQKKRKSRHRYRLEDFGLEERTIREKTAFFDGYWNPEQWEI
jgi:hypothetical protein